MIVIKIFWIILSLFFAYKFIRASIMTEREGADRLEFFITGFLNLTFGLFLIVQIIEKAAK